MDRATEDLYAPLIERDIGAIGPTIDRFLRSHDAAHLWTALTRFAVLAFVPSLHSSRALVAMRASWDLRDVTPAWEQLLIECATYMALARPAWSEPPILEKSGEGEPPPLDVLRRAVAGNDRDAATKWLAAHVDDADAALGEVARGEAMLMLDTARALEPLVGTPGRHALLRTVVLSLFSDASESPLPVEELVTRAVAARGSIETVREVFVWCARSGEETDSHALTPLEPYPLARDFAQTLIAHAMIRHLPSHVDTDSLLAAVHENLQHGDDYSDWSG